jgi:hypothetical protein
MPNNSTGSLSDVFDLFGSQWEWFARFGVYVQHAKHEWADIVHFEDNCDLPQCQISRDKNGVGPIIEHTQLVAEIAAGTAPGVLT